jgi:hypothetical protein
MTEREAMAGPPSRGSFPSVPGEPRVRRLGVGSSSGGDRPLRAQVIVALVCTAMLIAVPLYLLRRPSLKGASASLPSASASPSAGPLAAPAAPPASAAAAVPPPRLTLGAVQKVRCGASPAATPTDAALCDSLPAFEEALKKAIVSSEDCAPKPKAKGSINYVLNVDFAHKKLHVFPGASGEWRGKQARRATSCVESALKVSDWAVTHQYRFYAIAILASYAGPPDALPAPSATPAPGSPTPSPGSPAPKPGDGLPTFE